LLEGLFTIWSHAYCGILYQEWTEVLGLQEQYPQQGLHRLTGFEGSLTLDDDDFTKFHQMTPNDQVLSQNITHLVIFITCPAWIKRLNPRP